MPRVAGVDIPINKRIQYSLQYIYGVGSTISKRVLSQANVSPDTMTRDLTEEEIGRIRDVIDHNIMVEGDLRREVNFSTRRLIDIGCYRGIRHRRGLPVHGQRTRTNARSKRGSKKTVAGRRRVAAKK